MNQLYTMKRILDIQGNDITKECLDGYQTKAILEFDELGNIEGRIVLTDEEYKDNIQKLFMPKRKNIDKPILIEMCIQNNLRNHIIILARHTSIDGLHMYINVVCSIKEIREIIKANEVTGDDITISIRHKDYNDKIIAPKTVTINNLDITIEHIKNTLKISTNLKNDIEVLVNTLILFKRICLVCFNIDIEYADLHITNSEPIHIKYKEYIQGKDKNSVTSYSYKLEAANFLRISKPISLTIKDIDIATDIARRYEELETEKTGLVENKQFMTELVAEYEELVDNIIGSTDIAYVKFEDTNGCYFNLIYKLSKSVVPTAKALKFIIENNTYLANATKNGIKPVRIIDPLRLIEIAEKRNTLAHNYGASFNSGDVKEICKMLKYLILRNLITCNTTQNQIEISEAFNIAGGDEYLTYDINTNILHITENMEMSLLKQGNTTIFNYMPIINDKIKGIDIQPASGVNIVYNKVVDLTLQLNLDTNKILVCTILDIKYK